ncbi:MAG: single-stranded DNA-binding protein [Chloroflexi bacterium]|nr:single-stranded DNA-binding protein [Chloroflexota bacterium]
MRKTQLTGRLAADPKGHLLTNGSYVCNFRVLSENPGDERPIGFNIAVWGTLGETCAKSLKKGRRVYLEGALRFDPENGNPRIFTHPDQTPGCVFEVDAARLEFLD